LRGLQFVKTAEKRWMTSSAWLGRTVVGFGKKKIGAGIGGIEIGRARSSALTASS